MADKYSLEISNEGFRYVNNKTQKRSIWYTENYDIVWDIYINFHKVFDNYCKIMMKY